MVGPWRFLKMTHGARCAARFDCVIGLGIFSPFRVGDQLDVEGGLRIGPSVILPHPLQGVISLREGDIKVVQRAQSDHLAAWCARQRDRCARVLELGLHEHPAAAQIVQAVLLGYREGIPSQWVRHFAATGTLHVFAISGLHVGLVALMLIASCVCADWVRINGFGFCYPCLCFTPC